MFNCALDQAFFISRVFTDDSQSAIDWLGVSFQESGGATVGWSCLTAWR